MSDRPDDIVMFYGKSVDEMSREELLKAVKWAAKEISTLHSRAISTNDTYRAIYSARRKVA